MDVEDFVENLKIKLAQQRDIAIAALRNDSQEITCSSIDMEGPQSPLPYYSLTVDI